MRHLILALPLLLGCPQTKPVPVPEVKDTELCGKADENLERMQCSDRAGHPMWVNKKGERFKEICERVQEEGGVFLNPRCVSKAKTCKEAKACPRK